MKKYYCYIVFILTLISCSDIIEVPDISDDIVTLMAPANNSTLNMTTLTLSWNAMEDAKQYKVQVAKPDFENILQLVVDSTLTDNSISVQLEAGNTYQWRVRAENSGYTTSYSTYSFTLEE
ncbi:fibronectin type III domain-containing protein [Kordia zhangzhouensis]|uniref:fibronectin type III domain-containing protein n=1 Tax=Kordia zhangzhouensis TaxID=1620405 RepID=UPI0006997182|nr:fibronectin type III domain-containing protein [Kordia zhangzhouensis]